MQTHARVVVIGVVVGCSILYRLAKLSWKDVVLAGTLGTADGE